MKLFFPVIVFSIFAAVFGSFPVKAQNNPTRTGAVSNPTPKKESKSFDISKVDFKNYTFPDFDDGKTLKTFTLKNGAHRIKNEFPKYTLRTTYYFDLTGDRKNEAVTHIIAEGCQMGCETSNLFYIYTGVGNQAKLLWKIATGGDVLGGLKSANFTVNEITMEVFGDCLVENQVIKPEVDLKKNTNLKTTNYTRFVFSGSANGFTQISKDVLPLTTNIDFSEFRAQISFREN